LENNTTDLNKVSEPIKSNLRTLNLMKLLIDLSILKNTSIIIASHDLELLKEHTHQLLVLKKNGAYSVIESKSITIDELVNELDV
jgi:energy-coupling factor transporter ATP-binding protein EcfA2